MMDPQLNRSQKMRNMLNCLCSRLKVGERVEAWHHDLKRFVRCFMDESEDGWYEVRYALADIGTMDGANGTSPHSHSQTAHATKANATESATTWNTSAENWRIFKNPRKFAKRITTAEFLKVLQVCMLTTVQW